MNHPNPFFISSFLLAMTAPCFAGASDHSSNEWVPALFAKDASVARTSTILGQAKAVDRTFFVMPAVAEVTPKLSSPRHGGYRRRFDYDTRSGGWAGYYDDLGSVDASLYNTVAFWVRGNTGGETFDVGFVDRSMADPELDAIYVGSVQLYLEGGVTNDWQEVAIPLCAIRAESGGEFSLKKVAGLVLLARNREQSSVEVEGLHFRKAQFLEHDYLCVDELGGQRTLVVEQTVSNPKQVIQRRFLHGSKAVGPLVSAARRIHGRD